MLFRRTYAKHENVSKTKSELKEKETSSIDLNKVDREQNGWFSPRQWQQTLTMGMAAGSQQAPE